LGKHELNMRRARLGLMHGRASILVVLCLLGVLYVSTLDTHGMFMWDEAEYAAIGRSVLEGKGFSIGGHPNALRPPLLPLAATGVLWVSESATDVSLKLAIVLFALLGLAMLYHAVRLAHGRGMALVAAILLGLFPAFWQHTTHFLSEIPFLAFFMGAVFYMHHGLYGDPGYFKYSWACFGLALLTRYTAVLLGPILLLMLALAWLERDERPAIRARIFSRSFFLTPLVAAAILLPWFVRQKIAFGDALEGFREASGQLQVFASDISMPWFFYLANIPGMVTWIGAALILVGLSRTLKERDRLGRTCILVSLFVLTWFSFYRFKEVRLVTAILPFLAVLAATGAQHLSRRYAPRLDARIWGLIVGLVLGINSYVMSKPFLTQSFTLGYPVLQQALDFLEAHSDEHDVIMSSLAPQVSWYTGRRTTHLPDRQELAASLDGASWVLLVNFERGQPSYVPKLVARFTVEDAETGRIHAFTDPRYQAYVVRASELKKRL